MVRGGILLLPLELKFTPLEFETGLEYRWHTLHAPLKFTPLEFETEPAFAFWLRAPRLKFTPLEFETSWLADMPSMREWVKIYSVGV